MNVAGNELLKEQSYLEQTVFVIEKMVNDSDSYIKDKIQEVQELKKYIWENRLDKGEEAQERFNINIGADNAHERMRQVARMRKSLQSAYFARVDFEVNNEVDPIYIGLNGIKQDSKIYVCDWRTPAASLFYNYGKGAASYDAPIGKVSGQVTLKRQYKVNGKELERCFDSDLNIDDEYLQEVLSVASSEKMRNIVNTIQQDQNAIIRNTIDKYLIVQGVAGSGKTSVALHRIAYLLYQQKNLNSNNVLIFSPNDVFSSYISNVLPELGEDNVLQTTFSDFARSYLEEYEEVESFTEFIERYYEQMRVDEKLYELNTLKMSNQFKELLDNFIAKFKNNLQFTGDLKNGKLDISKQELNELLKTKFAKFPYAEKFDLMAEYLCEMNQTSYAKRGESVKFALLRLLNQSIEIRIITQKFLRSIGDNNFDAQKNSISYENITPMLYLNFELYGYPDKYGIKQVVIDEAQDYSLIQMQLIKNIFSGIYPAAFTILGDHNQTINPYHKHTSLQDLNSVFLDARYIELNKTYRSSKEIIDFTNDILDINNVSSVRKSNDQPVIFRDVDDNNLIANFIQDINYMLQNSANRVAIITKNNREAIKLYKLLKDEIEDISIIQTTKVNTLSNVVIMSSYISKGLEFGGVILYSNSTSTYKERDKYLYYVVCTRAQHMLIIYDHE